MARCSVDKSIVRVTKEGFEFPLGVYPIEEMIPKQGYTLTFESADADDLGGGVGGEGGGRGAGRRGEGGFDPDGSEGGGGSGGGEGGEGGPPLEFEEWPDRYVFDIVIRHGRLEALCRALWAILPGRIFPIVDALGVDAYREIDPYVAYDLVGIERFLEGLRRYRGYLMEDGLVGFGAMSEDPFVYIFVDEHKIVTVRVQAEWKDKIERLLTAFDLAEVDQIAGADAAAHEHRGVLETPADRPDLLAADEIIEELRDMWGLTLNVDPTRNVDDQGNELGITGWRCVVRMIQPMAELRYAEVLLSAASLADAEALAAECAQRMYEDLGEDERPPLPESEDDEHEVEIDVLAADRFRPEDFATVVGRARAEAQTGGRGKAKGKGAKAAGLAAKIDLTTSRVLASRWMA